MTQVWAVIAQKGGAGKTTLSLHIAIALAGYDRRVELLDVDPQSSAHRWAVQRKGLAPATKAIVAAQIFDEVERIRHKASTDIVIVDTSPRADRDSLIVANAADFIIVPVRPSPLDFPALIDTLTLLKNSGCDDKAVVLLNAVASATNEGDLAAAYVKKLGADLCPFWIGERVDFRHALLTGQGVTEAKPQSAAAKEILAATKWLLKHANYEGKADGKGNKSVRKASGASASRA